MNKITLALAGAVLTLPLSAFADGAPAAKSLASTMEVYVFPTKGQEASQQSQDESACYQWAVSNAGSDPFELADKAQSNEQQAQAEMAAAQQTGQGAGARGVLRGAAAGAIVGEISGAVSGGLGRLILDFASRYTTGPERLYATVVGAAVLGILAVGSVVLAEFLVLSKRKEEPLSL